MKKTIVTEKNINEVMGLVKKFFWTNKPHNFQKWHSFDSGWNPLCFIDKSSHASKVDPKTLKWQKEYEIKNTGYYGYKTPSRIEFDTYSTSGNTFIRVVYPDKPQCVKTVTAISVGDEIAFCRGKYLIIKKQWTATSVGKYIYNVVNRIEVS